MARAVGGRGKRSGFEKVLGPINITEHEGRRGSTSKANAGSNEPVASLARKVSNDSPVPGARHVPRSDPRRSPPGPKPPSLVPSLLAQIHAA